MLIVMSYTVTGISQAMHLVERLPDCSAIPEQRDGIQRKAGTVAEKYYYSRQPQ